MTGIGTVADNSNPLEWHAIQSFHRHLDFTSLSALVIVTIRTYMIFSNIFSNLGRIYTTATSLFFYHRWYYGSFYRKKDNKPDRITLPLCLPRVFPSRKHTQRPSTVASHVFFFLLCDCGLVTFCSFFFHFFCIFSCWTITATQEHAIHPSTIWFPPIFFFLISHWLFLHFLTRVFVFF